MSSREPQAGSPRRRRRPDPREREHLHHSPLHHARHGRYVGLLAALALLLAVIFAVLHNPGSVAGIPPGQRLPPFAVPLATGELTGDANVATHANQGSAGRVPACSVHKADALNVCTLYKRGPVVLALFVAGGSCPAVLSRMQALLRSFPGVQFAAVALDGGNGEFDSVRARLRALVRREHLTIPVAIDSDGVLATLYKVVSCPQLSFAYPGGVVQSKALLREPSTAALRRRVQALVGAAKARGWREPAA